MKLSRPRVPVAVRLGLLAVAWVVAVAGWPSWAWDATRIVRAAQPHGARAVTQAQELVETIGRVARADDAARLAAINDFFNSRLQFLDDMQVWGQTDYWASPLETLGRGAGDCEDYAIAKYFGLLAAGVPVARLRLVYVRAHLGGATQPHMVLAYQATPAAEPLVLDNLDPGIKPASRRPDLEPVFSFNSQGLWSGVGAQSVGDPVARLSRWREVLAKAAAEGFL